MMRRFVRFWILSAVIGNAFLLLAVSVTPCLAVTTATKQHTEEENKDYDYETTTTTTVDDDDDDMQYVRQVLNEHENDNPYDNAYSTEEDYQRHQQESRQRQAQQAQETAHRRAEEREAAFEQQLSQLASSQDRKRARQQKRQDARIVQRILQAFSRQDYYAILGLARRAAVSRRVPPWIPQQVLPPMCRAISKADIKHAYRNMGKRVHPDKNRDGRAEQAFVALEEALTVLYDDARRQAYDQECLKTNRGRVKIHPILRRTHRVLAQTVGTARKFVGPFAVPLGILAVVFV